MALGADRAIHLVTDGEEWDPQATAAAIVEAIRADEAANGPFDLVFFGNESADSGGYQVGIRVAYALGRPVATGLKGVAVDGDAVRCEQEVAGGRDVYVLPLPAVVTVLEGLNLPRYPSVPGEAARAAQAGRRQLADAAGLAAREGAARRPRGPGQAGRDPRSRADGGAGRRRGAPARSGSRDGNLVYVERRRRATTRRCRRSRFARGLQRRAVHALLVEPGDGDRSARGARRRRRARRRARRARDATRRLPSARDRRARASGSAPTAVVGRGTRARQRGARARAAAVSTCRSRRTASPSRPAIRSRHAHALGWQPARGGAAARGPTLLMTVQPHAVAAEPAAASPRRSRRSRPSSPRPTSSCVSATASAQPRAASRSPTRRSSSRAAAASARPRASGSSRSSPACSAGRSAARAP